MRKFGVCGWGCRFEEAVEAYEEALRLEPGLASVQQSLAEAKARVSSGGPTSSTAGTSGSGSGNGSSGGSGASGPSVPSPGDLGGLGGLGGLAGLGGGGGGGMPDLSSLGGLAGLMNNPMVQSMMQNPQMMQM